MFENAKYIKAQEYSSEFSFYDPAPFFRKEFTLKDISEAHIFVQSPGFARYYINGKDITKDLFISAISDYTKILWYNEYDKTSFAHRIAKTEHNKWEDIRNTWRKTLAERYTDSNGRCTVNEQTAVAMLLRMNVGENRTALAEQLLSVVARDGDNSGSHNHHMYSGVIAYFFRGLLGITPLENAAGFEKIELCPSFITELGFVKGSIQTVRGKIDAEWQTESGRFKYTVTLPENISATFRGRTLKKGINKFFVSQEEFL